MAYLGAARARPCEFPPGWCEHSPARAGALVGFLRWFVEGTPEAQENYGEPLPNLIVQLPSDALPLRLLSGELPGAAGTLTLQPIQQTIETAGQPARHPSTQVGQATTNAAGVETVHQLDEPVQRASELRSSSAVVARMTASPAAKTMSSEAVTR